MDVSEVEIFLNEPNTFNTNVNLPQEPRLDHEVVPNLSQAKQIGQGTMDGQRPSTSRGHTSSNQFLTPPPGSLSHDGSIKIFENDFLEVFMVKTFHNSDQRFKVEKSLFNVKIHVKKNANPVMITDILETLQLIVKFALSSMQPYVDQRFNNFGKIFLFQNPMTNGISSRTFNLKDPEIGTTDLLAKLNRYLVSNNELSLNESFFLSVDVLSLTNDQLEKKKKRNAHFGASHSEFKSYWCVDVSAHAPSFINNCLLLCCIFANLQFDFFLSGKKDPRYRQAMCILSNNLKRKKLAVKILTQELLNVKCTLVVNDDNPLDFSVWKEKICDHFKCQITIFTGKEFSSKILMMHPESFDDSLKQFYFYAPNEMPHHLVFIRHITSYFKANILTCTACKKTFKTHRHKHLCHSKENCFACRRPILKITSFFCPVLQDTFCDKLLSKDKLQIECAKCNLLIESKQCLESHQKICGKSGLLGFKCKLCNKFYYRNGTNYTNRDVIAQRHSCGERFCRHCKLYYSISPDDTHLCLLKKEYIKSSNEALVFLTFAALQNSSYNCLDCYQKQNNYVTEKNMSWKDLFMDANFKELLCLSHKTNWFSFEPNAICLYKQNGINSFIKMEISNIQEITKKVIFNPEIMKFKTPKKTKITQDFLLISKQLEKKSEKTVMEMFLTIILNEDWCNFTVILSDPFGFFLQKLTTELISLGICPRLINNVNKVILLEIRQIKLRFITTEMYHLNLNSEQKIKEMYQMKDHFFPYLFNKIENYNYCGNRPDVKYFIELSDSEQLVKKKMCFVKQQEKVLWKFSDELFQNLDFKCNVLFLQCWNFIQDSLSMQTQLKTLVSDNNPNKNHLLNPFHNSLCSYSGYIYKLFKAYFLFFEEIYCVVDEYGSFRRNFSKDEILWAKYMTFEYPSKKFRHQFNHPHGQKYFKECIPDLYSPVTKEVWFFMGCYWHGHSPKDCLKPSNSGINQSKNKTFDVLNKEFTEKIERFKRNYPDHEVFCMWECHFKQRKATPNFLKFEKSGQAFHPLSRLRPRTTVRGGYNQVFSFEWCKEARGDSESFFCLDINGLYSYCAINFPSNYGKYDILIGDDLKLITIKNNQFFYKEKRIFGAVQLTILPPRKMFLPFLMYRIKCGKNVLTLCRTCSENFNFRKNKFVRNCRHSEDKRALTSSYLISEIEYAMSLGYEIIQIHEIHAYHSQKFILQEFVKCIDSLKLKHSTFSSEPTTEFCQKINSELNLPQAFMLEPKTFEKNEFKQSLYKIATNSFFGKLQQRSDYAATKFIATQYELEEMYKLYGDDIFNITCHNETVCQIDFYEKITSKTRNLKQNCYLGAEITSNARLVLYQHLKQLNETEGVTLFYCDTDSIFGSVKKDVHLPLKVGNLVGEFKNVAKGEILSFYCLGLKNYCLTYCNENGEKLSVTKLCGLNLNNCAINNSISDSLYQSYLNDFFCAKRRVLSLPKIKKPRLDSANLLETFSLDNNVSSDRQIDKKVRKSFPCGYFYKRA